MNKIILRKFKDADITIFTKWLQTGHVAKWYKEPENWLYEISNRDTEYSWIKHFIVETNGVPIGFCQYYDYSLSGEDWHGNMNTKNTYSIDYLIGEENYLRHGFGKAIVLSLVNAIKNNTDAKQIIVQPEAENKASRNTLLAAGFFHDEQNDVFYMKIE